MLADIRRSLANLAAPPVGSTVQLPPQSQLPPTLDPALEEVQVAPALPGTSQDPTAQALLAVSQILTNMSATSAPPPPTTPWANDSLQNSVLELKRQVEALAAACNVPPLQVTTASPSVTPAPGSLTHATPLEKDQGSSCYHQRTHAIMGPKASVVVMSAVPGAKQNVLAHKMQMPDFAHNA
ncbi:hypothetical protein NDU88_003695 [Pleurodeles waltl]|uniref:Uncharacterized protein n=1 Tax=Pleurodeles waltl TaxID=8319 RepID=A0AAV7M516_PLEWA|nr:hypothetical protein NDU88_003695 [Pleurodeles waltl]